MSKYPYFIAELSGNHCGSYDKAIQLIDLAKQAGANAVKLQTFNPSDLALPGQYTVKDGLWKGRDLYELYTQTHTPWEWHKPLFDYVRSLGLEVGTSVFSPEAVRFVETLEPDFYKIASFEIRYLPLLQEVSYTRRPVIVSTGMATPDDVQEAIETLRDSMGCTGFSPITLLACSSKYPTDSPNVSAITTLKAMVKDEIKIKVGYSDHTPDALVPTVAALLGATVIEKHIKLEEHQGPDWEFSANYFFFKKSIDNVREAIDSLGTGQLHVSGNPDFLRTYDKATGRWLRGMGT